MKRPSPPIYDGHLGKVGRNYVNRKTCNQKAIKIKIKNKKFFITVLKNWLICKKKNGNLTVY